LNLGFQIFGYIIFVTCIEPRLITYIRLRAIVGNMPLQPFVSSAAFDFKFLLPLPAWQAATLAAPLYTINKLMCIFNLSHGSVLIFAERFIDAMLHYETRFCRWPSVKRRRQLAAYGGSQFGFDGLIGSMDGTHFYLKRAPRFACFPEAYFDTWHKGGYGYNCLLTADHTGTIIGSLVGWPGSQCDTVLQPQTALHRTPWAFMDKGAEFIFVDCGFSRQMYCVPPYKGDAGRLLHNKVPPSLPCLIYFANFFAGIQLCAAPGEMPR
jgi:hypothetical protein